MLVAVAVFAVMDLSNEAPGRNRILPVQVTFIRGLASLPFLLLATATVGRWRDSGAESLGTAPARGVLQVATLYLFVYAVSRLSLATALHHSSCPGRC